MTVYTKLEKGWTVACNILDQTPNDVTAQKRIFAYFVDWAIGGIITGLPGVFIYAMLTKRSDMFSGLYVFEALGYARTWALLTGALCILFAVFYYVYVPWRIYPGQTLGKKLLKFKIVKKDGSDVDFKTLLIRQVICIFLIEGAILVVGNYIRQMTTLILSFYVDSYWQIFGMAMMGISTLLVLRTGSGRALHDYIAKTKVVMMKASTTEKEEGGKTCNKMDKKRKQTCD